MRVVDSKKLQELRSSGKSVRRIEKRKKPQTKPPEAPKEKSTDHLKEIVELLRELTTKEAPIPIANVVVQPSEVVISGHPRISKIIFTRDERGFIKEAVPVYVK